MLVFAGGALAVGPGAADDEPLRAAMVAAHRELGSGHYAEAEAACRAVLGEYGPRLGASHPAILDVRGALADTLRLQGKLAEAEKELQEVVALEKKATPGVTPREALAHREGLAVIHSAEGRNDEALPELRAILEEATKALGPEDIDTLKTRNDIVITLQMNGRLVEATAEARQLQEICTRVLGPDHPDTFNTEMALVRCLDLRGQIEEAEKVARPLLETRRRVQGDSHPDTLNTWSTLALLELKRRDFTEGERDSREVFQRYSALLGPTEFQTLHAQAQWAGACALAGHPAEAERTFREVVTISEQIPSMPPTERATSLMLLGSSLLAQKKYTAEAVEILQRAEDIFAAQLGADAPVTLGGETGAADGGE